MIIAEILGFIAALAIGIALGLIGGGGSILTVPVLVYLLHIQPVLATAYSLFVVGFSSLIGSLSFYRRGLVSLPTVLLFGTPSVIAVYLTRRFLVPAIPLEIGTIGSYTVTRDAFVMVLFALLMLVAAFSMISNKSKKNAERKHLTSKWKYVAIVAEGLIVGLLTGLVGAGGGFLIIPALVLFAGLNMKMAVGTSLMIIAAKSLIGFLGDISNFEIEWSFLLGFTAVAVIGIFLGTALSRIIAGEKLQKAFGVFVLAMGIFVLSRELWW